eukprot:9803-Heterococcus_DN1.PRE.3
MTHTTNKQQNSSSNTKENAALLYCSPKAAQQSTQNNDARNLVVYCNLIPTSGNAQLVTQCNDVHARTLASAHNVCRLCRVVTFAHCMSQHFITSTCYLLYDERNASTSYTYNYALHWLAVAVAAHNRNIQTHLNISSNTCQAHVAQVVFITVTATAQLNRGQCTTSNTHSHCTSYYKNECAIWKPHVRHIRHSRKQ